MIAREILKASAVALPIWREPAADPEDAWYLPLADGSSRRTAQKKTKRHQDMAEPGGAARCRTDCSPTSVCCPHGDKRTLKTIATAIAAAQGRTCRNPLGIPRIGVGGEAERCAAAATSKQTWVL